MSLTRDSRTNRRRRVMREHAEEEQSRSAATRISQNTEDMSSRKGGAGYSQDVRRACGQRLVQLIPVRIRSFSAAIALSFLIPGILLTLHFLVYVNGWLNWHQHPMARTLDIGHHQSIAAWLSSQLWLLCLGATLLTFQLRRHKLDDYNGEYRLWFWMVATCLLASVDATTHIVQLFGLALDHWTQANLGWSGNAVVKATATVLVGMLGLRLLTELKRVPASLCFWLTALVAWAVSTALSQPELKIELSEQYRYWLRYSCWLVGLTCIWVAALSYLRTVYIEAQRRFLLRNRVVADSAVPLRERLKQSMPKIPRFGQQDEEVTHEKTVRTKTPRKKTSSVVAPEADKPVSKQQSAKTSPVAVEEDKPNSEDIAPKKRLGLPAFLRRNAEKAEEDGTPREASKKVSTTKSDSAAEEESGESRWAWLRGKPPQEDEEAEFRKLKQEEREAARAAKAELRKQRQQEAAERKEAAKQEKLERRNAKQASDSGESTDDSTEKKSWLSAVPKVSMPRISMPKMPQVKMPKVKLPSLSALQLKPPGEDEEERENTASAEKTDQMRQVSQQASRPSTSTADEEQEESTRPLSKAERKRLRRQQRRAA